MADNKRTCTFDGCDKPHEAHGYCHGHYQQLRRGSPLTTIHRRTNLGMTLGDRLDMYTDKTGDCWVWTGPLNDQGYGIINTVHKRIRAHRASYELAYGPIPEGMLIDHRCYTPACVKPPHLRVCTQKQNMENHNGARADSKSGVRGVSWSRQRNKWVSMITHNQHSVPVGRFDTIEEAEAAIIAKRNELFTHNDADRV